MKEVSPNNLSLKGRLRFLVKDSVLYGGAAALNKVFSLSTFPLLARHFSVAEYGLVDMFMVFASFITIFFVFGQDSAVARFFYEYKDEKSKKELISQSFTLQVFFLILALPLLWLAAGKIGGLISDSDISESILRLNLLQIPFMVMINFSQNLLKWTFSRYKFLFLSLGSVFTNMLLLLIGVFIVGIDIKGVFIVALATQVIFGLLGLFYIREWLIVPTDFKFLRELAIFAIPYGLICCLGSIVPTMERSLVNSLLGESELGKYAAGAKVAMLMTLIVQSFQTAWGPFSLAIHKEPDAIQTYNWVLKSFVLLVCMSVLTLSAISDYLLLFLASNRYEGASVVVFPLAMGLAIQAVSWITEIGIGISKRSYLNLYGYVLFVLTSFFSIYYFAKIYDLFGVALGVMIGQVVKALVSSFLSHRVYPLKWSFRPIVLLILFTIIIGLTAALFGSVQSSPFVASAIFAIGIFVLPLMAWFLLFEISERKSFILKIKSYG